MVASGVLFVVATPIGNLGDMTARAIETLRTCDRVVAEDTRRSRQLLTHFDIHPKAIDRIDDHATERDIARVLARLVEGERVALVTDAGTPSVSDPGEALVDAAIAAAIPVVAIPGASAVLTALVASGLAGLGRGFRFVGFLPRDGAARREVLAKVCETPEPIILFEAPGRLRVTLSDLADATPERGACVARELTKIHEEIVRGTCASLAANAREWIGEIALVLGPHTPESRIARVDDAALDARIDEALARGEHPRATADRLTAWSGRPKREVYERIVGRKPR